MNQPTEKELKIYSDVWSVLNQRHNDEEGSLIREIAKNIGLSVKDVDSILIKVGTYKDDINSRLFVPKNFALNGVVTSNNYDPTSDTISVKLKYKKGKYSLEKSQKDSTVLRKHVFDNMFMVRVLVVGFYDCEDRRIDLRVFESSQKK